MATQVWTGSQYVEVPAAVPGENWAEGGVDEEALDAAIADVIGAAPGALDTLNELAAALGDDASYAATITTALGTKIGAADVFPVNGALGGMRAFVAPAAVGAGIFSNDMQQGVIASDAQVLVQSGDGLVTISAGQAIVHLISSTNEVQLDGDSVLISADEIGFFSTAPVAKPDGATAGAALEALGLAANVEEGGNSFPIHGTLGGNFAVAPSEGVPIGLLAFDEVAYVAVHDAGISLASINGWLHATFSQEVNLTASDGPINLSATEDITFTVGEDTYTLADLAGGGIAATLIDAAGDLIVGTADDTAGILSKGTGLQVLRVNSGATALEWANPNVNVLSGLESLSIGAGALGAITSGVRSIAIGLDAVKLLTDANDAIGIGVRALSSMVNNTTGGHIAIGTEALMNNTTGQRNVAIGYQALKTVTTGGFNVAIGYWAMSLAAAASANNIGIGSSAGRNLSGTPNLAIGSNALTVCTTGVDNIAIGFDTLKLANAAISSNLAIGPRALDADTTGTRNHGIGVDALGANTTGNENVALGFNAMLLNTTGANGVAIGSYALAALAGANDGNTAIGDRAMQAATSGSANVAIGQGCMSSGTAKGTNNVAIGYQTMKDSSGSSNIAIGTQTLRSNTATGNIAIGHQALYAPANLSANATTSGTRNVAVGTETGQNSATQRNDTVALGYRALIDGDYAIAIGSGAQALHANAVALGDAVVTTTTNQVNIGTKRLHMGAPNSAPADADLVNGQVSFYLDQTGNTLSVKARYSDGTIKTGTMALT